ncbi:MAG: hypothetical protein M5U14_14680 [Acidimicrobiia bacterium]|nr:hypothetical protein [Acidimicrobiia bacterium]
MDPSPTCTLCETPLEPGAKRCRSCGLYQAQGPRAFSPGTLWALAGGLVVVYGATLLTVALAR